MMKKIYNLSFLTTYAYVLLSLSYGYGVTPPIANPGSPAMIDSNLSTSVVTSTPLLLTICEFIKQGDQCYDQKDYQSAIGTYKQALRHYAQHHTEESILLSMIYHKLGITCLALKAYRESALCLQQALRMRESFLSIANSSHNKINSKAISEITGESHHHLGCLYLAMDQPREAIMSFKAALATEWQHHEKSIETRCALAKAYQQANAPSLNKKEKKQCQVLEKNQQNTLANLCNEPVECHGTQLQLPVFCAKNALGIINRVPKVFVLRHSRSILRPFFSCTICGKKSSKKTTHTIHMRIHTGEKPFTCPICKKKFAQKQNMKTHIHSHTGKKPFACPVCQKKFTRKWTVKIHMRVHTGEKPFACPICKKKFAQKQHIKGHIQRMHPYQMSLLVPSSSDAVW